MLVAFQMFTSRLAQPLLRLSMLWQEFQQAAIAVKRLGELVSESRALQVFLDSCVKCGACTDKCHYYLGTAEAATRVASFAARQGNRWWASRADEPRFGLPVGPYRIELVADRLGIPVANGYGLTEAGTVLTLNDLRPFRADTVGKPVPGVELKILNPDRDGIGEVIVRGKTIMAGYLNDPDLTAETIVDGWLRTGDLGYLVDGELVVCGRIKDLICIGIGGSHLGPKLVYHALETLDLPAPLAKLRHALLAWADDAEMLDSEGLLAHLQSTGLASDVAGVLAATPVPLPACAAATAMPAEAEKWFGRAPPDLSLTARERGPSWVYSYLMTFYLDPTKPTGVNNYVLPNASMPHVLGDLQGWQVKVEEKEGEHGGHHEGPKFELVQPGSMTPNDYKEFVADNFGTTKGARWKIPQGGGIGGGFSYQGDDASRYQTTFQIKSKEDPEAWSALIDLAKTLDTTPPESLEVGAHGRIAVDLIERGGIVQR